MTEEQVTRWSKCDESKNGAEGGLGETGGVDMEGMYSEGWVDDDRYKRGAADLDISTTRGGMSMVAGGSLSKLDAY